METLHLTVAAVIEHRNRYLFVEEIVAGRRVINQPAGHVEAGESLPEAVIREVREETGWTFRPEFISGIYLWQAPGQAGRFLRVVFCGSHFDHDANLELDTGIIRTLWLTRAALLDRQQQLRSPMVLRSLDDFLAGQRLPVDTFQPVDASQLMARAAIIDPAA